MPQGPQRRWFYGSSLALAGSIVLTLLSLDVRDAVGTR